MHTVVAILIVIFVACTVTVKLLYLHITVYEQGSHRSWNLWNIMEFLRSKHKKVRYFINILASQYILNLYSFSHRNSMIFEVPLKQVGLHSAASVENSSRSMLLIECDALK